MSPNPGPSTTPTAASTSTIDPSASMKNYFANGVLPKMVWNRGKKGKSVGGTEWGETTSTHRAPTNLRLLKRVEPLSEEHFDRLVLDYFQRDSFKDLDISKIVPRLTVPASGFNVSNIDQWLPNVMDEYDVVDWIKYAPCTTLHSILRHMDPAHELQNFISPSGRSDLAWQLRWNKNEDERCSVEAKPPWVYAWLDLVEFTSIREYPIEISSEQMEDNKGLDKYQKLWCHVFDYAVAEGTHYFIVSTYQGWVFGCFSDMYSTAWVTPPKAYDTKGPTIIQCLFYWVQSSMSVEGSFVVPEVRGEPSILPQEVPLPVLGLSGRRMSKGAARKGKAARFSFHTRAALAMASIS